jgi:predicted enzyme related to lactoylglutathione lyase
VEFRGTSLRIGHEPFNYVTVYVEVDDIPAYLAKAEQLGGKK